MIPQTGGTPNAAPSTPIDINGGPDYQGFTNIDQQREAAALGILNRRTNLQSAINSTNASQLQQAWGVNTPEMVTGMPLVMNGRVFFGDWGGNAYAVDASTGDVIWQKQVDQPKSEWPWHGFAGSGAVGDQYVYFASVEGTAYALDMNTGDTVWQTKLSDNQYAGNLGKLMYYDGKLILGLSSVEEPLSHQNPNMKISFQGSVMALDGKSGEILWETKLVDSPGNGVAVWGSFAVDPTTNTLFFGTGNNYEGLSTQYSDSAMALDVNTGDIKWSTQVTDKDIWLPIKPIGPDYDFGAGPQLFNATVGGETRQMVGIGQKSGYYWAFDRTNGDVVWKTYIGYAGVGGGMRGEASTAQGYVFAWSNNNYSDGKPPEEFPITVKALDARTGQNVWSAEKAQPAVGWAAGFLSNDVYFVGSLDGTIKGYRANDGQPVFETKAAAPVGAPLVVVGNTLFVGGGVPKAVGGTQPGSGVWAYSLGGQPQDQPNPVRTARPTPYAQPSPTPGTGAAVTPMATATPVLNLTLQASPSATP